MSTIGPKRLEPASPSSAGSTGNHGGGKQGLSRLWEFVDDAAGAVMILFALTTFVMFMMIGLAVDYGRFLNARDQTLSAIDAAVLAAGRALQTGSTQDAAILIAKKYYAEAVKNRITLKANSDTITFVVTDNGTSVQAKGNAAIKTPFMGIEVGPWKGVKELALIKDTEADQAKASLAVGGNSELNLEISMMLDVSGSMCNNSNSPCTTGTKLDAMKTAAKDLINIVVWADQSEYTSKVAIVPFSGDVRLPASLLPALIPATSTTLTYKIVSGSDQGTYYFAPTPCAAERAGTNKYTDLAPNATNGLVSRVYSNVSKASTTTGACAISADAIVLPLTSNKSTLEASINALKAQGGTAGHVGTAWAYYMISPKWNSLLTGTSTPAAFGAEKHKKIAILMTDGEYNHTYEALKDKNKKSNNVNPVTYSPIRAIPTSSFAASGDETKSINAKDSAFQAVQICSQMKTSGIEVYTVGFELPNQTAINTLASCATDATHAYTADNAEELKQAFRDIALKVSSLYLSK